MPQISWQIKVPSIQNGISRSYSSIVLLQGSKHETLKVATIWLVAIVRCFDT